MAHIVFNVITVNGQKTNTTISVGSNHASDWSDSAKRNLGFGMMYGENALVGGVQLVFDPDIVDSTIIDSNLRNP